MPMRNLPQFLVRSNVRQQDHVETQVQTNTYIGHSVKIISAQKTYKDPMLLCRFCLYPFISSSKYKYVPDKSTQQEQ
jgi:hypothetical protein